MSGTDDLGRPVSYLALEEGTAVLGSDGDEVGHVAHVLADEENDIFDGIVISHGLGHHTFADAEQVADDPRARRDADHSPRRRPRRCPSPARTPRCCRTTRPSRSARLADKLRRAWDLLSGNY